MSLRDNLRKITVGSKNEYKTLEMDYEGEKVVFKQPSLRQRKDLIERSVINKEVDGVALQAWSVIYLTYDTEGNRVFDDADFDTFMNKPSGSFVDVFAEKAMSLLGNTETAVEEEN